MTPGAYLLSWLLLMADVSADVSGGVAQAERELDAWQLEEAKAIAETLLAQAPLPPENQLLAAEVLHQRGDHLQALSLLRSAEEGNDSSRLEALRPLLEASAAYATAFVTVETPHFRIHYLDKDEIVARYAEPVLEAAYRNIGADLQFSPAERGEKIAVEIYPDAHGLAGATGLTVKEIETSGTIAVCKFHRLMITSPLATSDGYDWADTVAHEFTHLIISKKSRNSIPIWLHEGIAKFFESRWKGAAGLALSPYGEKLLAGAVRTGKFITFAQMHPSMAKLPSQDDTALAFAEVFTVIEYLTQRFGTQGIAQVLTLAGHGMPIEDALVKAFGMDLQGIEKAWKKYLNRRPFHEVPGAAPQIIRLSSGEEDSKKEKPLESMHDKEVHDAARLGELLQLRNQPKAAVVEYEKAIAKGGQHYPTLVNRLARAYVETERSNEALKLLESTLAAHPDDNDAHLLAGRIRLSREDWDAAQRHFEAVRLQNPFNPEIHVALAALARHRGDTQGQADEKHFFELAEHPRPTRTYEVPSAPVGEAYVSITTLPWGDILLDNQALAAPVWNWPIKPGKHFVMRPAGSKGDSAGRQEVSVGVGEHRVAVLK